MRDFRLSDVGDAVELGQEDQKPGQVLMEVISQSDPFGCWILSE